MDTHTLLHLKTLLSRQKLGMFLISEKSVRWTSLYPVHFVLWHHLPGLWRHYHFQNETRWSSLKLFERSPKPEKEKNEEWTITITTCWLLHEINKKLVFNSGKTPGPSGKGVAACWQQSSTHDCVKDRCLWWRGRAGRASHSFHRMFNEASPQICVHPFLFGSWIINWEVISLTWKTKGKRLLELLYSFPLFCCRMTQVLPSNSFLWHSSRLSVYQEEQVREWETLMCAL